MINEKLNQITDCLYRVSAKAIIVRNDRMLMTLEIPEQNLFGSPGGGVDHGQQPRETILRELQEELNLDIKLEQISEKAIHCSVGDIFADDDQARSFGVPFVYFYYKVDLVDGQIPTKSEHDFRWVDLEELKLLKIASNQAPDKPFLESILEKN